MKGADEAVEEELPVFEKRLAQTLEDAIRTVKQEKLGAGMVKNPCPFYIHLTSLKEVVYAMIIKVTTRNV